MSTLFSGPCTICGGTNYPLSGGGPTICPSCDCGNFGMDRIKKQSDMIKSLREEVDLKNKQIKKMTSEIVRLKDELKDLEDHLLNK